MTFRHVSVDLKVKDRQARSWLTMFILTYPVEDVKCPVQAESEQIVTRDTFSLAGLADQK